MKFQIHAEVVVKDKNGHIVRRKKKLCNSYTKNMIALLKVFLSYSSGDVYDTSDVPRATDAFTQLWRCDGSTGNIGKGIVVGSGDTAVTINDFYLDEPIGHGVGVGQLQYGATSFTTMVIIGSTAKFIISRTFSNDSGDDITVEEVALLCYYQYNFMFERTLLQFLIANGESGTVTYTISVTV